VPELIEIRFKAQKRMVGTAPRLLGVVSHAGALGAAVDDENGRIKVEDHGRTILRQRKQICAQGVVEPRNLANRFRRQSLQETAQCALVGKPLQSQHVEKGAVVLQDVRLVDPTQAHNDDVEQRQDQI
jgi:hypothetical protein